MRRRVLFVSLVILSVFPVLGQARPTSPKAAFGFEIGDDYCLVNYTRLASYWTTLDRESDRMTVVEIGRSAEGRPLLMAVITAPENRRRLGRYKDIARRLALAEGLSEAEARTLAAEGRAVVWIDGGLHATEIVGSQQLIAMAYEMVSRNDPETLRVLRDDILLLACPNPDGLELVADWYMREPDPKKRSLRGLPRLYHKYIGHDNNRDFYMVTQPETEAVNRVLYREWFPQILYNHHQTGPAGTVLFAPPFRNPFNYFFDPLVPVGIDLVSAGIHSRFITENKPGATMRTGAHYSTWWSGGLRSTSYFHNVIGILTEIIGNPTPMEIPFLPQRQLPGTDLPYPVAPQEWHFRQSIAYCLTANRAILDIASKHRQDFLYRIYLMGRNAIERGRRDSWTVQPAAIEAVEAQIEKDGLNGAPESGRFRGYPVKYYEMLRDPARRDPRGFIIPSGQPDFLTAVKFVNSLIKNGITVLRATADFAVSGKTYPAGSFIVKSDQAYRPHIMAMFEPQDHPHDFQYPGGPPTPPYDSAGWTLAFQMGVEFDRILEGFEGPFERIPDLVKPSAGKVEGPANAAGYLLSHRVNDAVVAVHRLLAENEDVQWLGFSVQENGQSWPPGTMFIAEVGRTKEKLERIARETGLDFTAVAARPAGEALRLRPVRVGLWDTYGGSMASGWVRWLLEKFELPFEVVYAPALDAGGLKDKYDALIFVSGAIPRPAEQVDPELRFYLETQRFDPESVPAEYKPLLGSITLEKTIPELRRFLEEGGTVLTIGSSTALAEHLGLPVVSALTEKQPDGSDKPLRLERYYIPGSVLEVRVDNANPVAYGMPDRANVFFNNSPVFKLLPEASLKGVRPVAWFESRKPLRSGWAWGQHYLEGGAAVVEAGLGKGKLYLFGPEITFRAQPHGTFKFLFNGILLSTAERVGKE